MGATKGELVNLKDVTRKNVKELPAFRSGGESVKKKSRRLSVGALA